MISKESITLVIAIWGAVLSTVALIWNISRDVLSKPRVARSKDIFEPLHTQLVAARKQIADCERANAVNFGFWLQLNDSGRIKELPSDLQRTLREFHSETIPNYETAWNMVNGHAVQSLLEPYGEKYGVVHSAAELGFEKVPHSPKWYRFLSAREFQPALLELEDHQKLISLWNKVTNDEILAKAGLTRNQFLRNIWNGARTTPAFQNLCQFRSKAMRQSTELIEAVFQRIKR